MARAGQPIPTGRSPAPLSSGGGCSSRRAIAPGLSPTLVRSLWDEGDLHVLWSSPKGRGMLWAAPALLLMVAYFSLFLTKFAMTSQAVARQGV